MELPKPMAKVILRKRTLRVGDEYINITGNNSISLNDTYRVVCPRCKCNMNFTISCSHRHKRRIRYPTGSHLQRVPVEQPIVTIDLSQDEEDTCKEMDNNEAVSNASEEPPKKVQKTDYPQDTNVLVRNSFQNIMTPMAFEQEDDSMEPSTFDYQDLYQAIHLSDAYIPD